MYLIFWGSNWNNAPGSTMRGWLTALYQSFNHSAWQGVLTQYCGTSRCPTPNVSVTSYTDTGVSAPASVNAEGIRQEATNAITKQGWSVTTDSQFVVLPAPGSSYEGSFLHNFCAYHEYVGKAIEFIPYAGDEPWYGLCAGYDPNKDIIHVQMDMASHEYAEAVTDPVPGQGWMTADGYEISDICSTPGVNGPAPGTFVTENWSNSQHSCSTSETIEQPHPLKEASGKLDVVWRNAEAEIEFKSSTNEGATWSAAQPLGGAPVSGEPSIVETTPGNLAVFWRSGAAGSTFGNLMELTYNGSTWSKPINLGMGTLGGQPYAVGQSSGVIDVFWRGENNEMEHAYRTGGEWHLTNMGASLTSDPSPVMSSPGVLDVFFRGSDGTLWHFFNVGGWKGPDSLHMGTLGGQPKAVGQSSGTVDVFWRGTNNALWHAFFVSSSWHGPESMGGSVEWDPSPAATGNGNVEVWWRGTDSNLWHDWYTAASGTWSGVQSLGAGPLGSEPQAASAGGHHFVYWFDSNLWNVWSHRYLGSGWIGPEMVSAIK